MKGQFDYKEKMQRNKQRRTDFLKRVTALTLAATIAVSVPVAGTAGATTTDVSDEMKPVEKVVDVLTNEVEAKGEQDTGDSQDGKSEKDTKGNEDVKKDEDKKSEETKSEKKPSEESGTEEKEENPELGKGTETTELVFGEDYFFDVVVIDDGCEVVFYGSDDLEFDSETIDELFEEWYDGLSDEEYEMYFGECPAELPENDPGQDTGGTPGKEAPGKKTNALAVTKVTNKESAKPAAKKTADPKTGPKKDTKKATKTDTKPKSEAKSKAKDGKKLPNTATDTGMYAVAGAIAMLLGVAVKLVSRIRRFA